MKFARAISGVVVDVVTSDPAGVFHPDIAAQFVQVPEDVQPGWLLTEGGDWTPPPVVSPPEPGPTDVPSSLSRIQFASAAFVTGIITDVEAEEWSGAGTLPAVIATYIEKLPAEMQPLARIRFRGAQDIGRQDQNTIGLANELNLNSDQVDDLFRLGATF